MPGDRLSILACSRSVRRSPTDRHGRTTIFFGAWGVLITLLFAASVTKGQETGSLSAWQSREPAQESVLEDNGVPIESVIPGVSTPAGLQRLPVLEDAFATPRNNVLEIVQRRDDYAVRRHRRGFFQRFRFSGEWIDRGGQDNLGIGNMKTSLTCAVPLGSFENLLIVTTGFEATSLSGSAQFDAPTQLYDVGVDFMWRNQLNDRWGAMLAVRPGVASDFQSKQDSFRVTGRALATWRWLPERLSLIFGVVYLDRNDLPILPGAGLVWTPNPDWRLDVVFPRPKLARRLVFVPGRREDWVYLAGALGGRTWAVQRRSGAYDQLTLRDYRVSLGWERILDGGSGLFGEVGYVFGRESEYDDSTLERSFEDAVMLLGGVTY